MSRSLSQIARFATLAVVLTWTLPAWAASGRVHTVKAGESLGGIAPRYGCTIREMMKANRKLKSPDRIRVGQRLKVPRCTAGGPAVNCGWRPEHIDSKELGTKMRLRGFSPPQKFRALVVKTTLSEDGSRIEGHQLWDYRKKGASPSGWNPASTIKLYSGIAALHRLRTLGFSPKARVTFHDEGRDRTFGLDDLYEDAVHWSKNVPHNRLVQLAGFDYLNGSEGPLQRAGLDHSYIMRAYARQKWVAQGQSSSLRPSPAITVREKGRKTVKLPAQKGSGKYPCYGAACTSLSDLARMMCTVMLHEQLPPGRRLGFGRRGATNEQGEHLAFIRQRLNRKRKGKKDPVWDIFEKQFIPKGSRVASRGLPQLFRKAGFARQWASDNIYVYLPGRRERWIVAMAGYPGRYSLTEAARIIASLIADQEL